MSFEHVHLDRDGAVATLTIDRPKVNALSIATLDELRRAVLEAGHDAGLSAVVITGAGDKAFVAGADIAELAALSASEARAYSLAGQHVFDLIEHLGKPVIAAVNGYALGGGCELAMACTLRLASETATFGQPEVRLGLLPGFGGTQRLPRLIGKGRALDLLLTGRSIDAPEAFRIGLANRVVPSASLLDEARALARALAEWSPLALAAVLQAVNRGLEVSCREGAFIEAALFGASFATEDMREGTSAFLEKRQAAFKGK